MRHKITKLLALVVVVVLSVAVGATSAFAQRGGGGGGGARGGGGAHGGGGARGGPGGRSVVFGGGYRPYGLIGFGYPYPCLGYAPYGPFQPYGPCGPYGPYGYGPYPPYDGAGYGYESGYGYDQTSALRLDVKPKQTEVYIDGYRAGVVDDFDGIFQRLRVWPGDHELVLYLDGFRTVHQHIYLAPGADQKISFSMEPLRPGDTNEPRPVPPAPMAGTITAGTPRPMTGSPRPLGPPQQGSMPPQGPPPQGPPPQGPPPPPPSGGGPPGTSHQTPPGSASESNFGTLSIRVLPADADVFIDGEKWAAPTGQARIVIQMGEGKHKIEVSKDGFEKYSSEIEIRRGETNTLNVSLLRANHF